MASKACCSKPRSGCEAVVLAERADGERRQYYIKLVGGQAYPTIAGLVRADEVLEGGWGWSRSGRLGRVSVVPPTTFDLMEGFLERRTQVIYPKDLGLMVLLAGIKPGSYVVEAGAGSGFLTIMAALVACPTGRVYSFDVRRDSLEAARRNLERVGVSDCVELRLGDVRDPRAVEDLPTLDSVLLDMPDPWNALPTLYPKLKPGGPAVVFLPTANQLEKLYNNIGGCWAIQDAYETMARKVEVRPDAIRPGNWLAGFTGYIVVLRRLEGGSEDCVRSSLGGGHG